MNLDLLHLQDFWSLYYGVQLPESPAPVSGEPIEWTCTRCDCKGFDPWTEDLVCFFCEQSDQLILPRR